MTEYAWFGALCDDDYEFLGVPDETLRSSWAHCRDIVLRAEANGFDNVLLPSGYALGIDATAFASAIAVKTSRIKLLLAVRLGELVVPQLARQIATLQQIAGGRLVINAISSDLPGETMS
ncbi:MAG: LLM class flavin-dependent oxidoreductase, partial [Ilumatobacteraceae bacterium]